MVKHDIDSWILDEETLAECYREKGNTQGYESKMELVGLLEQLKEYQQLEEQGRLVILPCKVGDTVYCIENKEIYTCTVGKISISKNNGVWVEINFPKEMPDIVAIEYNPDDFSKTVFLTKSEAEAKLKELRHNND
nr:MAG TPA: hypothetical protein [Caudoviricetes sp.]